MRSLLLLQVLLLSSGAVAKPGLHPHPLEAVAKCKTAMEALSSVAPASRAAVMAGACSDLYVEARCRDAFRKVDEPIAARMHFIVDECRAAYCPLLTEKPPICGPDGDKLKPSQRAQQWLPLQAAIFQRDLGVEIGKTALAEMMQLAAKSMRPITLSVAPPATTDDPVQMVLDVSDGEIKVYSQTGVEGTVAKPLLRLKVHPDAKQAFDDMALRSSLSTVVSRRWPKVGARPSSSQHITIKATAGTTYAVMLQVLDAARHSFAEPVLAVR